jgi:hypothetical protein
MLRWEARGGATSGVAYGQFTITEPEVVVWAGPLPPAPGLTPGRLMVRVKLVEVTLR